MTTRKQIAELAALLAQRKITEAPMRVAEAALALARYGAAATSNATALCNGWRDQAQFEKKKASIERHASAVAEPYGLRTRHTGDPRGFCLRLLARSGAAPLRGNTWGGDEEGFGV